MSIYYELCSSSSSRFLDIFSLCHSLNFALVGEAITITTTDVTDHEWMKTEAEYSCDEADSVFYLEEVQYEASFTVTCENSTIFGKKFPYWKVPGTEYPAKPNIFCALPTNCYNFPIVNPPMNLLGLTDTYDKVNRKNGDMYQYFCSLDGQRGMNNFSLK